MPLKPDVEASGSAASEVEAQVDVEDRLRKTEAQGESSKGNKVPKIEPSNGAGPSVKSESSLPPTNNSTSVSAKKFVFVTGNANKLREVQQILAVGDSGIQVTNQALDVPEVQGSTQEVAIAKCKSAAQQLGKACVTEDTALCFDALGGLPGPYIKDFMTKVGHEGLNTMLQGFPTHRAHALCTFAYSPAPTTENPSPEPILFEGKTEGEIVPPRGDKVFGWDPVFMPDEGKGLTYAEMDQVEKNKISHRYKALSKLKEYLQNAEQ